MGLPFKAVTTLNIQHKNKIVFDATKNCSFFKNYLSSLTQNLVSMLPPSPNIFKVASYYDINAVSKDLNFQLLEMSPEKILSILKGLNPSKAVGIDNLSGKLLKGGADILAQSISQLCNLSIKFNSFRRSCKIFKVKPNKLSETNPQSHCPILLLPLLSKIIERIVYDQADVFE